MNFLKLASAAVGAFFPSLAIAASVGLFSGTFDPPSWAEIGMLRCALGDTRLSEKCQEIGKQISRLLVLVKEGSEEDPLASTRERVLMVRKALQEYGDRVDVSASSAENTETRTRAILEDKNIDRVIRFIGEDGFETLQSRPDSHNPKLAWVVFSLEDKASPFRAVDTMSFTSNVILALEIAGFQGSPPAKLRSAIAAGTASDNWIEPGVKEVIEKLGLYQDVRADLSDLQKSFFQEGWRDFLKDLASACPITLDREECNDLASRWETIAIIADDRTPRNDRSQLIYKKAQSEDRWAEKFSRAALKFLEGSESYRRFKPIADDIASRVVRDYPSGKLPHLRKVTIQKNSMPQGRLTLTRRRTACSAPEGTYNADMDQYLADRFPRSFAAFLKTKAGETSVVPVELYVHNHPVDEAYDFHRSAGYAELYFIQTRRGQFHRDIYLAVKTKPLAYRVVVAGVRGNDRQANVSCQIHRADVFRQYRFVQSRQAQPLFVLNPRGRDLRLNRDDLLLFGFKGAWTKRLLEQNWQRRPLTKDGLDIELFTHPGSKQKLVVARNVYGDDAEIVLRTFYDKGARGVLYLGSVGAVADYRIGDVVIPNEFVDDRNNTVPFRNNFARAYQSDLASLVTVHGDIRQAWAQTLFHETTTRLLEWRARSVGAVDIEGLYLGRFAQRHKDLAIAALFVVSDQTMGEITIDETNAQRGLIDDSVDKLVSFLLPKVLNAR